LNDDFTGGFTKMNQKEFTEDFLTCLQKEAEKRNGRLEVYPAVPEKGIIQAASVRFQDTPFACIVYPELMYQHYRESTGMEPLVRLAMSEAEKQMPIDFDELKVSREKAPERLGVDVVNYKANQEKLRDMPYEKFLDLALVMKWRMYGNYRVEVSDRILSELHMTKEEAFQLAKRNTFQTIQPLRTLEEERKILLEPEDYEKLKVNPFQKEIYILSTKGYECGAAAVADRDTLKRIHKELGGDFYILPSSEHRMLVVEKSKCRDVDKLMYKILDEQRVAYDWERPLSKNTYFFDGERLQLTREMERTRTETLKETAADTISHRRAR